MSDRWIIRDGNVHGSCLGEHLPKEFPPCAWYPIVDWAKDWLPTDLATDLIAVAYPIPPRPVTVKLSWGDLQKLNRGEDIQTKVKGIGDAVVRV